MDIRCTSCTFRGVFIGRVLPSKCPSCNRTGTVFVPPAMTECAHCFKDYPMSEPACVHCGVERISRYRSAENDRPVYPDGAPVPRDNKS